MPAAPPLITGKIAVPPRRRGTVRRQRLLDALDDAVPLVVVVAQAGWGKTTLLTDWADAATDAVAWLTLDEADDEPFRFWTYLVSAISAADPHIGEAALAALRVTEVDPLDVAVPQLLNDLAASDQPLTVVLDDYHVLGDRRIHEGVEFLLAYLPPRVRLVVAGRADPPLPLARSRARGELAEIRADGLRFTLEEAAPLVADVARSDVPPDRIDEVLDRTEGWAAGLQLVALALRASPESLSGPRDDRHVVDYLTTEVLDGLRPDLRDFLLRTAVLDRMTGPLCDHLLDRHDSAALLAELEHSDLFVVPIGSEGTAYRYHRLFRDALRRELRAVDPAAPRELLRRAAAWHVAAGEPEDAVRCLIEAGDPAAAGELLATADDDFMGRGALGSFLRLGDALPEAVVRANSRLGISLAAAAGFTGQIDRVAAFLDSAEAALTDDAAPPAGWRTARSAVATLRTAFRPSATDGVDTARQAVALESDPALPGWVISRIALGGLLTGLDRNAEAAEVLAEAVERAPVVGLPPFTRLQAAGLLAVALLKDGRAEEVRHLLETALPGAAVLEQALGLAAAPAVVYLRLAEGLLARTDGDVDRARSVLAHTVELAQAAGHPSQIVRALTARAEADLAAGDRRGATAAIAEAEEIVRTDAVLPSAVAALAAAAARIGRGAVAMARRDSGLAEPLTDREHAVLRALQGPLNQREIGAELYLSINTVKGYTKSLYRKLDVASRPEAVRRGRDLGLI